MEIIRQYMNQMSDPLLAKIIGSLSLQMSRHTDCMRIYHRFFTSHGITHSIQILKIIQKLQSILKIELSQLELKILYVSCFFHDIGMLPTNDDLEFINVNRHKKDQFITRMKDIRKIHASTKRLVEHLYNFNQGLNDLFNDHFSSLTDIIVLICSAHTEKSDVNLFDLPKEDKSIQGERIRILLLASLLRIADELDVGRDRALPNMYYELNVIPDDQQFEHIKHLALEDFNIYYDGSDIILLFKFDKLIATNIQVLKNIYNFINKIETEIGKFSDVLSTYDIKMRLVVKLSQIDKEELSRLFLQIEDINKSAEYRPSEKFVVLKYTEEILRSIYNLKNIFKSNPLKFFIIVNNDKIHGNAYQEYGANNISEVDMSKSFKNINKDIFCTINSSDGDLATLYHFYYPDIYIIDMRDVPNDPDFLKIYIAKCALLVTNFCVSNKRVDGRIVPFVFFLDNNSERLISWPDTYVQIVKNYKENIRSWNAISY